MIASHDHDARSRPHGTVYLMMHGAIDTDKPRQTLREPEAGCLIRRPDGTALHLTGPAQPPGDDPPGQALTGAGYAADVFGSGPGAQRRYRRVR